jgi:hypothetical protein
LTLTSNVTLALSFSLTLLRRDQGWTLIARKTWKPKWVDAVAFRVVLVSFTQLTLTVTLTLTLPLTSLVGGDEGVFADDGHDPSVFLASLSLVAQLIHWVVLAENWGQCEKPSRKKNTTH